MKLKALILENFRAYPTETRIEIGGLTAFIGKNDVGKSSILEALEIFFNSDEVSMEPEDDCVHTDSEDVRIGCVFSDLPSAVVIDDSWQTELSDEYLLNEEGDLEVHQVFDCSLKTPKTKTFIRAMHPTAEGAHDLLQLKSVDLRARLDEFGTTDASIDRRANAPMRRAIWDQFDDLAHDVVDIPSDEQDAKKIWDKLKLLLPTYAFFRADRPSKDQDDEVQDPMKMAVREAIAAVEEDLERIKEEVQRRATEVATNTLEKLNEMDPTLASQLTPEFSQEPKWEGLFKLRLRSDDGIPMNKRGSGARRLLLISFFRAEAERKRNEGDGRGLIYAIEEPETSQHPDNQRMLAEALIELSNRDDTQVILTTHVPGLASLLPTESLRHVVAEADGHPRIVGGDEVLETIAEDLGVLPNVLNQVQVVVCMEGPNDVTFIQHISRMLNAHDPALPDLSSDPRIACMPLGGSNLKNWVEKRYLQNLGLPEVHIYDRDTQPPDDPTYAAQMERVNQRRGDSWAECTVKRAIENYLHPQVIREQLVCDIDITDTSDVPRDTADALDIVRASKIKRDLNDGCARRMTLELLEERDPQGEIKGWLKRIGDMLD